jgi:hypothetical protein
MTGAREAREAEDRGRVQGGAGEGTHVGRDTQGGHRAPEGEGHRGAQVS